MKTRAFKQLTKSHAFLALLLPLAGCGGGGASPHTSSGGGNPVITLGGLQSLDGTTSTSVTVPSTGGTTVTATVSGQPQSVVLPSGLDQNLFPNGVVPPNTVFNTFPKGQALINGLYGAGGQISIQSPAPGDPNEPNPGPVVTNTGMAVDSNGNFTQTVALPMAGNSTSYVLGFPKMNIPVQGFSSEKAPGGALCLTVIIALIVYCSSSGTANFVPSTTSIATDVPSSISGNLPANGQSLKGSSVNLTWPGTFNDGRTVKVKLAWQGTTVEKTSVIKNGSVNFTSFGDNLVVPQDGLQSMQFYLGPMPAK